MAKPRALIAVEEEHGIIELAHALIGAGYELITAGQAGRTLTLAGLQVLPVELATRVATLMSGRVDALHPSIVAGIVAQRGDGRDMSALEERGLPPVDIVIAQVPGHIAHLHSAHGVAEQLSSGHYCMRSSLLRMAATNWQGVLPVCDPNDYDELIVALSGDDLSEERRRSLALKAFRQLSQFDELVLTHVCGGSLPPPTEREEELDAFREAAGDDGRASNPTATTADRQAAPQTDNTHGLVASVSGGESMSAETAGAPSTLRYEDASEMFSTRGSYHQVSGSRVSLEALVDVDLGWSLLTDLPQGESVVLCRRGHPCAVANVPDSATRAMLRALGGDPAAALGGTLVCSGRVDLTCARALKEHQSGKLLSTIAASHFDEPAIEALAELGDIRLLQIAPERTGTTTKRMRATRFGVLLQDLDADMGPLDGLKTVGSVVLVPGLESALMIAMATARHVGTIGAVIAEPNGTVAICAGQAHLRDAVQIAAAKARRFTRPCVMAVDAPLDHPDALMILGKTPVKAVVHPGPTPDEAAIATAADGAGITLLSSERGWHRV